MACARMVQARPPAAQPAAPAGCDALPRAQVAVSRMTTSKGEVRFSKDQAAWHAALHRVLQPVGEAQPRTVVAQGEEALTVIANGWGGSEVAACELLALRHRSGLADGILVDGEPAELPPFSPPEDTYTRLKSEFVTALLRNYDESLWTTGPPGWSMAEPVVMPGPRAPGLGCIPVFQARPGITVGLDVPWMASEQQSRAAWSCTCAVAVPGPSCTGRHAPAPMATF